MESYFVYLRGVKNTFYHNVYYHSEGVISEFLSLSGLRHEIKKMSEAALF